MNPLESTVTVVSATGECNLMPSAALLLIVAASTDSSGSLTYTTGMATDSLR